MYALAIHGGAGLSERNLSGPQEQAYLEVLEATLRDGLVRLRKGQSSLDTVEQVTSALEDCPLFNAGRGSVFNSAGQVECDAALMVGRNLAFGGVTCVRRARNPIALARLVLEKTPHLILACQGAEQLARDHGLPLVEPEYFHTAQRYQQLLKARQRSEVWLDHEEKGTVGAVALDRQGNLAAASSTGGMTNKLPGRVGDTPIIGAGLYADNRTCAVSCTGRGEKFLNHLVAHRISNRIELGGSTLQQAAREALEDLLEAGDGGLIAITPGGELIAPFTSAGMFRGLADSHGLFQVAIWP